MNDNIEYLFVIWTAAGLLAWLVAILYLVQWMFT